MDEYLEMINDQSENPYELRGKGSWVKNLSDLYGRVIASRDKRDGWAVWVLLDCQKAFYTLSHKGLVKKNEIFRQAQEGDSKYELRIS